MRRGRRGTSVTVDALFYNTPARQKFLRGARSEWRAITDVITAMALARPDVRIAVTHDGRESLTLPPASSLRERVAALWGVDAADALVAVDDVRVHSCERPRAAPRRCRLSAAGFSSP